MIDNIEWKYRGDDLIFDNLKICENVFWGSKRKTKNYSLYEGDLLVFTGNFSCCKEKAIVLLNNRLGKK